jgi:periplasmic divalent cation tolerance protein
MKTEFSLFYTTFPDEATAQKVSLQLLEEKLVACTNLFPVIQSQYWWQGKIENSKECVLILKSESLFKARLEKRFLELHPYETPCFLEIRLDSGNPGYLDWLSASLKA